MTKLGAQLSAQTGIETILQLIPSSQPQQAGTARCLGLTQDREGRTIERVEILMSDREVARLCALSKSKETLCTHAAFTSASCPAVYLPEPCSRPLRNKPAQYYAVQSECIESIIDLLFWCAAERAGVTNRSIIHTEHPELQAHLTDLSPTWLLNRLR